jgi:hypothetical protein
MNRELVSNRCLLRFNYTSDKILGSGLVPFQVRVFEKNVLCIKKPHTLLQSTSYEVCGERGKCTSQFDR